MTSNTSIKPTRAFNGDFGTCGRISALVLTRDLKGHLLDRLLFTLAAIAEYAFGLYVGAAIGWALGWYVGNVYAEHVRPVYFSDVSELKGIVEWAQTTPPQFAGWGKLVGALAGAIAIMIINSRLLTKQIVSLYENGVTEPEEIARALGKSVQRTRRRLARLHRRPTVSRKRIG